MSDVTDGAGTKDREDRINPAVFYTSAVGIALFAIWTMFFIDSANFVINSVLAWISDVFGWFYFVAVVLYLVFVIGIGLSRFGKVRLGPDHARPEFNAITWAAMLFAAGIGIDLLFFCVSEPVTQFLAPPEGEGSTVEAARHAMQLTFLHWGLSGWGVYTLVGMSLAYFSYRHGLPLTIRSALFPIFGQRIYGVIGHTVDIAAVIGTVFGIATSLGIGIIQLNYGLEHMFGIPQSTLTQGALVILIIVFAALSAATGVERGIRRLSEFNMALALLLLLFVLFVGETTFLLNALVMNIGDYLSDFVSLSFNTYAFDPPVDWLNAWTVFFWAWWIAWGPFVGLFLARISRGRTIRQFVAGTLILPLVFMMGWMSIMGNSAIELVMSGATEFGDEAMANPGSAIYLFMQSLPLATVTTIVVTLLGIVFFITSGDSGSLVLSNFTSTLKDVNSDAPVWMRVLWATIIGVLTLALLLAGGLEALQSTVVIMGLPFSIVLFLMMLGLFRALRVEGMKEDSHRASLSGYLSGRIGAPASNWRQRIARATSFPTLAQVRRFMRDAVRPAMEEIRETLEKRGFPARIVEGEGDDGCLSLNVAMADDQDFTYEVWPVCGTMPAFAVRPQQTASEYYRAEVHLFEGSQGYDLMGYTKEQVIEDILDQFERHMHFLHTQREAPGGATRMPDDSTKGPD
ncbi:choline/carnitine/betaine transporter [Parvibaculum lavamentivorans DS-1]|uniref:Choline/carnitine/betaine transporter n=1 Tax=Parvibaculum lavamentivorans (strain DS-1 / DSM 13023 / NCIMB 13966) TaxID=402881 RepID=A7HWC8_PARL1|nr:choline BCCT transporter BetT [Parvibaculum lavamentivorans]ABS64211.1 choline/carnitine/betaine transporter [Parvibaculum lavamentivorans DS-1]